ncbi:predicted protein [Sparassis crispa]|uniref:DH domain-containing protein n=1 Tax=Sparassis crispa TaxID=139825 RepID=A0A401G5L5_9APHY|nr:predicted protein [Sparassis crispa]GBE77447.1 predicted protein [Sparassis crispa]
MANAVAPLPTVAPLPPPSFVVDLPSLPMATSSSTRESRATHTPDDCFDQKAWIEHVDPHVSPRAIHDPTSGPRVQNLSSSPKSSSNMGYIRTTYSVGNAALTPSARSSSSMHTQVASNYQQIADALKENPPAFLTQPPPVPPKSEFRPRARAICTVPPSDQLRQTVSDPGHSSASATSSSSVRNTKNYVSHTHSLSGPSSYSSRVTWADAVHFPLSGSPPAAEGTAGSSSLSQVAPVTGRRRLRKLSRPGPASVARTVPNASGPARRSSSSSLWRALSLRSTGTSPASCRSSDSGERLSRSEDGHISGASVPCRPHPQTHSSSTTSEGTHSSSLNASSTTTPFSSALATPLTTPECDSSCMSPVIVSAPPQEMFRSPLHSSIGLSSISVSPRGSRKLKKKRPPHPPSAMMRSLSGSSPSSHTDLRNVKRSSTGLDGYLPPVRSEAPLGFAIPKELQVQPVSLSFTAFAEDRKRSSSHALSQLAWTGLCSSDLAALTSRQNQSPERAALMGDLGPETGIFDPYVEYVSRIPSDARGSVEGRRGREKVLANGRKRAASPACGTIPSSRSSSSSHINPDPSMPSTLMRRHRRMDSSSTVTMRRWTIAMADVSDEVLVEELDRLRRESGSRMRGRAAKAARTGGSQDGHDSSSRDATGRAASVVYGGPAGGNNARSPKPGFHFGPSYESDSDDEVEREDDTIDEEHEMASPEEEEEWRAARRALLCCRELLRTERNYQARLRQLLEASSSHPMFSLLLSYVPALIAASEAFLVRLVDDPSAWGVSIAFISCEEELEAAYVAWCGSVGEFFTADGEKMKWGRKSTRQTDEEFLGETTIQSFARTVSTFGVRSRSQTGLDSGNGNARSIETRRMSMFSGSAPIAPKNSGVFTAALGTGLAYGLAPSSSNGFGLDGGTAAVSKVPSHFSGSTLTRTLSAWKRRSMPSSLHNLHVFGQPPSPISPQSGTHAGGSNGTEKKLSVHDLVIQPTQRVMRYVLQYRDLLGHTPVSSPSRGLVERALESALRIAKKCDRAQGNSAFLRRP